MDTNNIVGKLYGSNQNTGGSGAAQGGVEAWSIHRFDSMLITYLLQRYGTLAVNKADFLEATELVRDSVILSGPTVDNVIRLFSTQAGRGYASQSRAA